ncbi:hypothetical protein GSI_14001 [Ganoderma sinense ZZ0214-1]|uniref:Uncharacterized protein n=1 Tax=Ganoderma sinense ZZ0214-1 TaxID=1077348 RepID=A0A2G8RSD1_9APHY|nr:hypothetical protein GSI_14001 [Ganoderma sinense ZZ0214-1]
MSSYHPTMPRPIPAGGGRSPSPTTSAHSGSSSQGGLDFSHGWNWRHPPARSSSGHSSDLIFSMEPEPRSASGSPCPGSADQPFLYDVPSPWHAQPPPGTVPVCPRCRRQFYAADHPSQQNHGHNGMYRPRALLCPSCEELESLSHRASRRDEDDFFALSSGRRDRTPRQYPNTYQPQHEPPTPTGRRHQHSTSAQLTNTTHIVGRAFPSYNGHPPPYPSPPPYTRSVSQPHQSAPRWTAVSLPPATFVTGSYRPQYQLPQLITQLEHRAPPAPTISPRTTDPIVMTPVSPSPRRRQS